MIKDANSAAPEMIQQKLDTCSCGCRGRDPQHATRIKRALRNIQWLDAVQNVRAFEHPFTARIIGFAEYTADGTTFLAGAAMRQFDDGACYPMGWVRIHAIPTTKES
jgi:hypothetical protein